MAAVSDPASDPDRPVLRIVKGDATPEEVAALVAVIAALRSGPAEEKPKPRSTWADPAHRMRATLQHGPGAWRSSGLPH
jgi:hypothetical protein